VNGRHNQWTVIMIRHRNRLTEPMTAGCPGKVGWRPLEWARAAGVSRSYTYLLLQRGVLRSVKSGSARIIVTSPSEYLASLKCEAA
jgi:hypothetical protein